MDSLKVRITSILRSSERIFKTDMVYLVQGGFWLTLLQVLSSASSFVLAVGFAHYLSKETYGTYKFIMSIGGILAAFSLTGLSTVVTNAAARGHDGTLRLSFKKNLYWGGATFLLFAATSFYYYFHSNSLLASGLLIMGIATPLLGSASLADSFLIGKKDFKRSALTSGTAIILVNGVTLLTAFITQSILSLIIAYMASSLITELAIYLYTVSVYRPHQSSPDPGAMSYGTHLSLIGIVNIVVDKLDSVLTFHFLGPAELAIYSFAIAMPEQLKGLLKNASSLALPKFSQSSLQSTYESMQRKMLIMTMGIALTILIYILVAPLIFKLFFPQYATTAVFFSQIYILTLLPSAAVLPATLLQALAAKKELYLFNMLSAIFQIACMLVGATRYGILGLIVAIGLSRAFRLIYSVTLVRNLYRKEYIKLG